MNNSFERIVKSVTYDISEGERKRLSDKINKKIEGKAILHGKLIELDKDAVEKRLTKKMDKEMLDAFFREADKYGYTFYISRKYDIKTKQFRENSIDDLVYILDDMNMIQTVSDEIIKSVKRIINVMTDMVQELINECGNDVEKFRDILIGKMKLPDVHSKAFKKLLKKYVSKSNEELISNVLYDKVPKENGIVYTGLENGNIMLINDVPEHAHVYIINPQKDTIRYERRGKGIIIEEKSKDISFEDVLTTDETLNGYDLSGVVETYIELRDYFKTV